MKKLLLISFCFLIVATACRKEKPFQSVVITQNETSYLSVHVIDNNGASVEGAKVSIYKSDPSFGLQRIYYDSTDGSGFCHVGKVLQGQYNYNISAKKDGKQYNFNDYFQAIVGNAKTIEANPFLNVGDVSLKVTDFSNNALGNVNIALIPYLNFNLGYDFNELIKKSIDDQKTDSKGWVHFYGVPADVPYHILAYYDSTNYDIPQSNNYVLPNREQVFESIIKVNL